MVVLIIFPIIFQTDISVIMLSIGGQGAVSLVERSVLANTRAVLLKWTRWTPAVAVPWWQHHKHCRSLL